MERTEEILISIVVAVYNIENYIGKCIESIVGQTYENIELILVDDGSTDSSGRICDRYAKSDLRIKVIHKPNGGLSDARNKGLDAANGDLIGIVDGDDWIHPQMYEIMVAKLFEYNADICTCWYERDNLRFADDLLNINDIYAKVINRSEALTNIETPQVVAWNKLYKKELFNDIRYPKGRYHEDEFVIHKLLYKCHRIAIIDRNVPLYFYTDRGDSIITNRSEKHIFDALNALEDRVKYAVDNYWEDVIPAVVKRYCDYCIDRYIDIRCKRIAAGADTKNSLWNHEKKMIKDYPYNIGEKYYQFAGNPKAYARMVLRKDRMAAIRKTVMETGHRIKCYIRHDGH